MSEREGKIAQDEQGEGNNKRIEVFLYTRGAKEIQEHVCLRVQCTVHLFSFLYTICECLKVHTIKSLELFTFLKPEMWYTPCTRLECSQIE